MTKIKKFWIFYFLSVGSAFISAAKNNLWILIITLICMFICFKIIWNFDE